MAQRGADGCLPGSRDARRDVSGHGGARPVSETLLRPSGPTKQLALPHSLSLVLPDSNLVSQAKRLDLGMKQWFTCISNEFRIIQQRRRPYDT
jgi:hypothetical protein